MSDYQRERNRAKLRADGGHTSLLIWAAIGTLAASGIGAALWSVLMSIK